LINSIIKGLVNFYIVSFFYSFFTRRFGVLGQVWRFGVNE